MLVFRVGIIPVVLVVQTARGIGATANLIISVISVITLEVIPVAYERRMDATAILIISVVAVIALDACAARNTQLRMVGVGILSVGIITDIADHLISPTNDSN